MDGICGSHYTRNSRANMPGLFALAAAISAALCLPSHHWPRGTRALTAAIWPPHPDHVVLLQVRQRVGEHIFGEFLSVERVVDFFNGVGWFKSGRCDQATASFASMASANSQKAL